MIYCTSQDIETTFQGIKLTGCYEDRLFEKRKNAISFKNIAIHLQNSSIRLKWRAKGYESFHRLFTFNFDFYGCFMLGFKERKNI